MGGGLTFLSKKSFNPSNWSNQRRVWEARQNSESERIRVVEREAQIKREREEEELARVVGGEEEGGRKALGFMYDGGKIPGLKKEGNGKKQPDDESQHESKGNISGADPNESNLFQRQPGDDDAAAAFRAMLAQGVATDDTDKQLDERNHHDVTEDAQTITAADDNAKNNDTNESRDNRTKLEKAVGRGINAGSGVTLAQQMERFPMLKDAPMVLQKQKNAGEDAEKNEQAATSVMGMNFKPLGQVLRNVQCMACKKWGHARGERECELSGWDPFRMNATTAAMATRTTAVAAPSILTTAYASAAAPTINKRVHNKMEEQHIEKKTDRKHKNRRKGDRHEKKKSKKHKRHRRERSPSSYSYSSYDSYSSEEERDKKRRRDYSSDDSDSRRRTRKGRRKRSSRR